jgi:heat shock protein HslJ
VVVSAGMTNRHAALVLVALVSLVIAACGGAASPPPQPVPTTLAGTAWRAVSVAGKSTVVGREPTIKFDTDRVTGSGGCNGFGGTYTFANGVLRFGEMPMTLMGCEDPVGSIETSFMQILTSVTSVSIDEGGQLLVEGAGGQVLFVPSTG